ncbi:MAG: glycosyltransferase [Chthoniobacteraceae bacterium]
MEDSLPSVSVVMPVYNAARFIREAIESVLAQTHPRVELIVVDGASTDGTGPVAAGYAGRLRYYCTGRDNVSIAKNFGIARALHPCIAFMSGDDAWHPEKLERQAGMLGADPLLSACVCKLRYFLETGCDWPASFPERLRQGDVTGYICETLLARREVFERVGVFDESLTTAEDVDWYARARRAGLVIGEEPGVLLRKRVHDRNISITDAQASGNLLRVLRGNIRGRSAA